MAGTAFGAAVSAMTGLAGGTLLLAVIAALIPTEFIIPLHAAVAVLSNGARVTVFFRHVRWKIVGFFVLGTLPGALIGISVFQMLNEHLIKMGMGIFILIMAALPLSGAEKEIGYRTFIPVGFFAGLFGVFFGSIGPLIARFFLRRDISKEELVGTKAACQAVGHLLKIPLFGIVIGANVLVYQQTLLYLGIMVLIGVAAGRLLLDRISEKHFRILYRMLLSAIALRIIFVEVLQMKG